MTPAARARRMLAALPLVLQGGANVARLFGMASVEMTRAEDGLTRLMRSRWIALARGWEGREAVIDDKVATELGGLGALFDLEPVAFEAAEHFRRRVRDTVVLYRSGLTTAPAILKLAAIVYLAEDTPTITWEDDSRAVATFTVAEPEGPRPVRLEVIDNPARADAARVVVRPGERFTVTNFGLDESIPEITIRAPDDAAVGVPTLVHEDTELRIIYVGKLAPGDALLLQSGQLPLVNGRPVGARVVVVNPFIFDAADSFYWLDRAGAGGRSSGARFSVFERRSALPPLPTGSSNWRFESIPRATLERYVAFWPDREELLAEDLEGEPAPAVAVEFRWEEAQAGVFSLRAPAEYIPSHFGGDAQRLMRALQGVLEVGRAAGIEARLELVMPTFETSLPIDDALAEVAVELAHPESIAVDAVMNTGGPVIYFDEAVPALEDRFAVGGRFDITRFEGSLYAETPPGPDDPSPDDPSPADPSPADPEDDP